jgi:hypothetical protein
MLKPKSVNVAKDIFEEIVRRDFPDRDNFALRTSGTLLEDDEFPFLSLAFERADKPTMRVAIGALVLAIVAASSGTYEHYSKLQEDIRRVIPGSIAGCHLPNVHCRVHHLSNK